MALPARPLMYKTNSKDGRARSLARSIARAQSAESLSAPTAGANQHPTHLSCVLCVLAFVLFSGKSNNRSNDASKSSSSVSVAESFVLPAGATKYTVEFPADRALKALIDLVADHVAEHGVPFEQALMARASAAATSATSAPPAAAPTTPATSAAASPDDTQLAFLLHPTSHEHLYYRWKVYSLSQACDAHSGSGAWRHTPFQMIQGGPFVIPPDPNILRKEQQARKSEREARRADKKRKNSSSGNGNGNGNGRRGDDEKDGGGSGRSSSSSSDHHRADRGKLSTSAENTLQDLLRQVTMDKTQIRVRCNTLLSTARCRTHIAACTRFLSSSPSR